MSITIFRIFIPQISPNLSNIFVIFQYLDAQIIKYLNKPVKTEAELEREQSLVEQKFYLTEERHFVMVPAPGSGVPGAPADWEPPEGMEQHTPVLFLDLNADDFSTGTNFFSTSYILSVSRILDDLWLTR